MAKSKELEVKEESAVAMAIDMSADAGKGMEGVDKESCAIPFLTILQTNSPQIEDVEGAKPGLFINTITNELYSEVFVIPCHFIRRFLRWAPRKDGGGYKGDYSPIEVETGTLEGMTKVEGAIFMDVPEGARVFNDKGEVLYDQLKDTRNHFILVQNSAGVWQPALLSLSSTQIKKSKRWMTLIQGIELKQGSKSFNPPSFSHIYRLGTVKEENSKGNWRGLTIELESIVEDMALYQKAKDFHKQIVAGEVKVAEPTAAGEEGEGDGF